MSRIGPTMSAVLSYVRQYPGCVAIRAARYAAPVHDGRIGLAYGYRAVARAIDAGIVYREDNPKRRGSYVLWPSLAYLPEPIEALAQGSLL